MYIFTKSISVFSKGSYKKCAATQTTWMDKEPTHFECWFNYTKGGKLPKLECKILNKH